MPTGQQMEENRMTTRFDCLSRRQKKTLSRRDILKRGAGLSLGAMLVVSGNAVICPQFAWALETTTLKPETMATLIQLARDIYPHDKLPDRFYAIAVKPYDADSAKDEALKKLIEDGVADLDKRAGAGGYLGLGWEEERVAILRDIEKSPFFQKVRSGLVTGLYNQKEVWPLFGYEGEAYSKGGYIQRGCDEIEWQKARRRENRPVTKRHHRPADASRLAETGKHWEETMAAPYDLKDDKVVVIIGSGAGGGTLGNELAQKGIDVVILEAGKRHEFEDFINDEWDSFA